MRSIFLDTVNWQVLEAYLSSAGSDISGKPIIVAACRLQPSLLTGKLAL